MSATSTTGTTTGRPTFRFGGRLASIAVVVVTVAVIAAVAWVIDPPGGTTGVDLSGDVANAAPTIGQAPPAIVATTVDGEPVSLAQYAGQPVWLTFGASWCGDCRSEAPDLQATYEKFKDQGLVVLAVNIDESPQAVKDYWARVGLTFPAVADTDTAIASRYRTMGIPTHYFIDRTGTIQQIRLGGLQPEDMERLVAGIMAP